MTTIAANLPQVFFPSVAAMDKSTGKYIAFGTQALMPDVRSKTSLIHPLRPSKKMSKVTTEIIQIECYSL